MLSFALILILFRVCDLRKVENFECDCFFIANYRQKDVNCKMLIKNSSNQKIRRVCFFCIFVCFCISETLKCMQLCHSDNYFIILAAHRHLTTNLSNQKIYIKLFLSISTHLTSIHFECTLLFLITIKKISKRSEIDGIQIKHSGSKTLIAFKVKKC